MALLAVGKESWLPFGLVTRGEVVLETSNSYLFLNECLVVKTTSFWAVFEVVFWAVALFFHSNTVRKLIHTSTRCSFSY